MTGSFANQPPVQHIGLTLTCLFIWFESIELLTRVILLCLNLFIVDIYTFGFYLNLYVISDLNKPI